MNAKPMAEMALNMWNRMSAFPINQKAAMIQNLASWLQAEQIEVQQAQNMNAAVSPLPQDEHFRA